MHLHDLQCLLMHLPQNSVGPTLLETLAAFCWLPVQSPQNPQSTQPLLHEGSLTLIVGWWMECQG